MLSTNGSAFLAFFFKFFPGLIPAYRRFERITVKLSTTKEQIIFLKKCLEEKVLPRSLCWLKRLDEHSPFPTEATRQLKKLINDVKNDLDGLYYKHREDKRYLCSLINDPNVWKSLQIKVASVSEYQRRIKRKCLDDKLNKLIERSPWTLYSNVHNVINLSGVELTKHQTEMLGYGLNFSLPHEKNHLLDFTVQLDKHKKFSEGVNYSFVMMNLDSIYDGLKTDLYNFLPSRFIKAVSELKKKKDLHICKADKGGKIVVMNLNCYKSQMSNLLSDPKTYKRLKSDPLALMQSGFNKGLKSIQEEFNVDLSGFKSKLPSLPYIYGLPKVHKKDVPLRPIISNVNSPSYFLSKWLAKKLSPLLGSFSDSHLRHNEDLVNCLRKIKPNGNKFLSFDVKALFTNVPLPPTLDFIKRKLPSLNIDFGMPAECVIKLITLCLENSFFQFEGQFYEQTFGTQMGNPLSPIVSGLFLEHIESELLPSFQGDRPLFWKRYVDDILCLVSEKFDLVKYLTFLNGLYPTIKFTYEWEENDVIPFLDVLIHNCKTVLKFSVYRKPTHALAYLHYFSWCSTEIKKGLAQTLFLRALRVCDKEYLTKEFEFICQCLKKLAYPQRVLDVAWRKARQVYFRQINGSVRQKDVDSKRKKLFLPYMPSLEIKKNNLKNFDSDIVFTYKNKLVNKLCKNRPAPIESKSGAGVYQVPCADCDLVYFGESGRSLKTRLKEHKKDIVNQKEESGLAVHVHKEDHYFNFEKAEVLVPCGDVRKRHIIESALIRRNQEIAVNLNCGFSPNNDLLTAYINDIYKERHFVT